MPEPSTKWDKSKDHDEPLISKPTEKRLRAINRAPEIVGKQQYVAKVLTTENLESKELVVIPEHLTATDSKADFRKLSRCNRGVVAISEELFPQISLLHVGLNRGVVALGRRPSEMQRVRNCFGNCFSLACNGLHNALCNSLCNALCNARPLVRFSECRGTTKKYRTTPNTEYQCN